MKLPVLTALGGAQWESTVISALETSPDLTVVRRCVDVVELLSMAAAGLARAALVSADLRRFDADAVDRLLAADVIPVGVVERSDSRAEQALAVLGVRHVIPADASAEVFASVVATAVQEATGAPGAATSSTRAFGDPVTATSAVIAPTGTPSDSVPAGQRGSVVAVWGPTGAPGRTTVAVGVADELARRQRSAFLVDADVYGGVVAAVLGLLDESPGVAAACRSASATRLDAASLAGLAWQLGPHLRVLTGIPRADRWPELRPSALDAVLAAARGLAEYTVVDCGFALEADEELSYDSLAPRRNGATLAALASADLVLAVGSADPIGLQRLVRGLAELRDAEIEAPVWVVLNRVRSGVVPGKPETELAAALQRFAGRSPAALLDYDLDSVDAALSTGKTLAEIRPNSSLRRGLVELAAAVADGDEVAGTTRRRVGRRRAVRR